MCARAGGERGGCPSPGPRPAGWPAVLVQHLGQVLCRLLACSLTISRLSVVCPGVLPPMAGTGRRRADYTLSLHDALPI